MPIGRDQGDAKTVRTHLVEPTEIRFENMGETQCALRFPPPDRDRTDFLYQGE